MIPYFDQPTLELGPLTIHGFGVLVAIGVLLGISILHRRAEAFGLERADADRFVGWILIPAFIMAHLFDRLVYFPNETLDDPLSLLRIWESLSSFGGFLGGTIGGIVFFFRHAKPGTSWMYVDAFAFAFPFAWIFGRTGCFIAYDHPGTATTFALGQVYRDGVLRHNLGLYEALYTVLIAALFLALDRRPRFPGFFLGLFLLLYAPFRFGLDFLRIIDARYFGLTPGQYGSIVLFVLGALILRWRSRASHQVQNVDQHA